MYLKSIEVHGFKSFCNKLIFEFHDGITGIVGPNGSGKSNVADAVRWVLGEQSAKQLRGAKMEDVIFSGTENRKPMGYAYVAITLDNSDHKLPVEYEEVTVARRVYRSGESEYLINGTSCRLKDVQEMFLDTGIGKEGYSIIGQGQIEKILSGKPDERRELFDEAAGIVKYKKRKQTAERNLMQERENLARAHDILSEQERQLAPLEKQAATAREYLEYREELKNYDVSMFVLEIERIEKELEATDEKHQIILEDIQNTSEEAKRVNERFEELEECNRQKDQESAETQDLLTQTKSDFEKCDGDIRELNASIVEKERNRTSLVERIQKSERDQVSKKEELELKKNECSKIEENESRYKENQDALSEQLNVVTEEIAKNEKQMEDGNQAIIDLLQNNSDLQAKLAQIQTIQEQNSQKKSEITQRILKNKSDEETIKNEISLLDEKLAAQEEIREEAERIQHTLKEELELLDQDIRDARAGSDEAHASYISSKAKLDSLKNLAERYDGFGAVIQRVMEQKERIDGIVGVVSDIFKVKKEHEVAIETALGGNIRNIITKNDTTAKQLIGFLKKNKYGRATFLPLSSVKARGSFRYPDSLKEPGAIGTANTLVEASKQFHDVIDYLLGQVLVVDTIDHATMIARKYNQSIRIVTLEGELLNPGGSMTGGAYKNTSNLLGRNRELEELEQKIQESKKEEKEWQSKVKQIENARSKKQKITDDHAKKLQEIKAVIRELEYTKKHQLKELDKNTEKYTRIKADKLLFDQKESQIKQQLSELEGGSGNFAQQNEKIKEMIHSLGIKNDELKQKEVELRQKLVDAQLEYSRVHQQVENHHENMERLSRELMQLEEDHSHLLKESEDSHEEVTVKKEQILQIEQKKQKLSEEISSLEEKKNHLMEEKDKISKERKESYDQTQRIAEKMTSMSKEEEHLSNLLENLKDQKNKSISYMWDEYELSISNCYSMERLDLPLSELKKGISLRREKIKSLGSVNVNAIDDYHDLSERYQELKKQYDDLTEAESVLINTIEELDQLMREQFEAKFKEIKDQFQIVFKELFGGGKADLELVEDEDILEAGIRIHAQPPGKKLQNMMQLSGGEKSLTAICLLFAIQNLKPSPFCLLDEIEAALDDSNVTRYAQYLHKLTEHTQFIVITHRHGTMEAADRLYGITMQEKGVSTLVSIDLIEDSLKEEEGSE